ncbi:MAG: zinc-binding dehydrogenase [Mycobacteriaceae bacterium]|nr:zinc-binding dehydrogenase [Mycobacteriaceae bacterium]
MQMRAARMHDYNQPLRIEEVPVPDIGPAEVLVKVAATGSYGVQYARLLGGGATVVAFARSDEKLALARENGAHHTVNTPGRRRKRLPMSSKTRRAGARPTACSWGRRSWRARAR